MNTNTNPWVAHRVQSNRKAVSFCGCIPTGAKVLDYIGSHPRVWWIGPTGALHILTCPWSFSIQFTTVGKLVTLTSVVKQYNWSMLCGWKGNSVPGRKCWNPIAGFITKSAALCLLTPLHCMTTMQRITPSPLQFNPMSAGTMVSAARSTSSRKIDSGMHRSMLLMQLLAETQVTWKPCFTCSHNYITLKVI